MITLQDLIDRFGEHELINLSDHDRLAVINETVIDCAIFDALATVESYINGTGLVYRDDDGNLAYKGQVPKGLVLNACDIARYYLYQDGITEIVEKRYKEAINWLILVNKNPAMLTGVGNDDNDTTGKSGIVVVANEVPSMWR